VQTKPIECDVQTVAANGRECSIRFKIRVLSTHYEKSMFIIRVIFKSMDGTKSFEVVSEPIRSVSKLNQIQKK